MAQDKIQLDINAADNFSNVFNTFGGRIIALNQGLQLLRTAFDATFGAAQRTIVAIAETTDKFRRTEIALTTLTGSVLEARDAMARLQKLARETPQQLTTLQDAFVQLRATGLADTERMLRALTDAVAAFGGSDADLKLVALAIQQMAGKGVISMEELRRQLGERLPTASRIMARELGMTLPELFKLVETGGLDAERGLKALQSGLEKDFAGAGKRMMATWQGATSNMADAWDQFVRAVGDAGLYAQAVGAVQMLTSWISKATDKLREFRTVGQEVADNPAFAAAGLTRLPSWENGDQATVTSAANAALGDLEQAWQAAADKAAEAAAAIQAQNAALQHSIEFWSSYVDGIGPAEGAMVQLREELGNLVALMVAPEEMATGFFSEKGLVMFAENINRITERITLEAEAFGGLGDSVDMAAVKMAEFRKKTQEAEEAARQFERAINGIIDSSLRLLGPIGAAIGTFINNPTPAGAAQAAVDLLVNIILQNEEFKAALEDLTEALGELVAPIAEALAPALHLLADVLGELQPVFDAVGDAINGLGAQLENLAHQLEPLEEFLQAVLFLPRDIVNALKEALDSAAGGVDDPFKNWRNWWAENGFAEGGVLTPDRMMPVPGAGAGAGLFLGHVGERVVPQGQTGGGGVFAPEIHLHGTDESVLMDRVRRYIEEMVVTGRLRTA